MLLLRKCGRPAVSSERVMNEGVCERMEEALLCSANAIGAAFSRSILVLLKKSEMLSYYLSLEPAKKAVNKMPGGICHSRPRG